MVAPLPHSASGAEVLFDMGFGLKARHDIRQAQARAAALVVGVVDLPHRQARNLSWIGGGESTDAVGHPFGLGRQRNVRVIGEAPPEKCLVVGFGHVLEGVALMGIVEVTGPRIDDHTGLLFQGITPARLSGRIKSILK